MQEIVCNNIIHLKNLIEHFSQSCNANIDSNYMTHEWIIFNFKTTSCSTRAFYRVTIW